SSTITAPSTKPLQKFTDAVIRGSSGAGAQMAIKSRTLLGGNWASATAAGAGIGGTRMTPMANNAAPRTRDLDPMPIPPSLAICCDRYPKHGDASIPQHHSQLGQPVLDKIARAYGEIAGSEDKQDDNNQHTRRQRLSQQSLNPSSALPPKRKGR